MTEGSKRGWSWVDTVLESLIVESEIALLMNASIAASFVAICRKGDIECLLLLIEF